MLTSSREGPLPGSANWTHEHADAANTRVSTDQLVKAPLGVLWFGGPSHDGILPRHGHGPQPQVIDGRLIIEGVDLLRAIDIYTGRLLWETKLPGVGDFYNNLAHQPGANASGSNFVSTPDGIYVAYDKPCVRLDPATGKKIGEFPLPKLPRHEGSAALGLHQRRRRLPDRRRRSAARSEVAAAAQGRRAATTTTSPAKKTRIDRSASSFKTLKGFNDNMSVEQAPRRHGSPHRQGAVDGVGAKHGFRHNAICVGGGRLYAIDRLSGDQLARLKRDGEEPDCRAAAGRLRPARPARSSGAPTTDVFGTWLSYSAKHDVLVEAGRVARDTLLDEPKGMRAYRAKDGKVLWYEKTYTGPAMIHGDTILQDQGGCDLLTGDLKMRDDPLTGELVPWTWIRNYGCNTPAASEHLLTFRSGAAGYFDLCNDGGTGNFGGFRSSCTNNLIVAGGVLTAPDYTRTCTCTYQNQTSLALIHMPEAEMWTSFGTKEVKGADQTRRHQLRRRRRPQGRRRHALARISQRRRHVARRAGHDQARRRRTSSAATRPRSAGPYNWVTSSGLKNVERNHGHAGQDRRAACLHRPALLCRTGQTRRGQARLQRRDPRQDEC